MMVVGTLPLILAIIISYVQGNKSLQEVIGSSFEALAYETSNRLDRILQEEIDRNAYLASHPTLILSAKANSEVVENFDSTELESQATAEEMDSLISNAGSRILNTFLKGNTPAIEATRALYITNNKGVLLSSINSYPEFLNQNKEFFLSTVNNSKGYAWIGSIRMDPKLNEFVIDIATPILGHDNKAYGVFHRIYNPKVLFSSSVEPITFGETGHVMLINSEGVVIDCPILPTGFKLTDPKLIKSVTGPEASWARTDGDGHGSKMLSIIGYAPVKDFNMKYHGAVDKGLFTFAWQSSDELFAPTEKLFLWISTAGVVSIFLIAIMGSLASNKIVKPIRVLENAAIRIGRGEEVAPMNIGTNDEIESLANEINTMNTLLKKSFSGLEEKVQEKTREVVYLQEYTESILNSVPDIIITFKENLEIEYANQAFEDFTGIEGDKILNAKLNVFSFAHKDQWKFLSNELEKFSTGISSNANSEQTKTIEYKPKDPLAPKETPGIQDAKNTLTFGDRTFYYHFFYVAIKSEKELRIGCLMREITEEKALEDQLSKAEKLSGLGTLAAGIAHEMNNPLFSIVGYTEAIMEENDPERTKNLAGKVLVRAKHMASIILNLSGYSRTNDKDGLLDVDLNEKLDASIEMAILDSYTDDIQIEKEYGSLPALKAKSEEIQQVFLNIIRNAVQAMEGKGQLIISTRHSEDLISIEIQDNGPGIPSEYLAKVFDPFFTTKDQGKGTGLGLNIVHNIVEKYGGQIEVDSKMGEGTCFRITFPVHQNHKVVN
jgi:signal transduction histidine kinase/HAMP domain-containing protein